jgi:hypothetical protein
MKHHSTQKVNDARHTAWFGEGAERNTAPRSTVPETPKTKTAARAEQPRVRSQLVELIGIEPTTS